jgi:AraC-like DNA-binding protein
MVSQGITLGADDYLAKPFNVQEAAMRFNKLLGISAFDITSDLIEGAETRMLEARNASMTTATETLSDPSTTIVSEITEDEELQQLAVKSIRQRKNYLDKPVVIQKDGTQESESEGESSENEELSMNDVIDNQLILNIEQYVQQNMSRGPINLEEMAEAMGMSMKPFFQKVRDVTGKTPAEVVRDLRLKHACILLQRTNINMNELANNVGFATAEHFMNMFRDRFGISPSEYRQRYRS